MSTYLDLMVKYLIIELIKKYNLKAKKKLSEIETILKLWILKKKILLMR